MRMRRRHRSSIESGCFDENERLAASKLNRENGNQRDRELLIRKMILAKLGKNLHPLSVPLRGITLQPTNKATSGSKQSE